MFNEIVALMNERVITAADWRSFIGQTNWLTFERAEPLGASVLVGEPSYVTGAVYEFKLTRIFTDTNKVRINVALSGDDHFISMLIDADELAIRMEDS